MLLVRDQFELTTLEAATCEALNQITESLRKNFPEATSITGLGRTFEFALVCGGWVRDKLKKLHSKDFDMVIHSDLLDRFVERLPVSLQNLSLGDRVIKATVKREMVLSRGACEGLKLIMIDVNLYAKGRTEAGEELEVLPVEIRQLEKNTTIETDSKTRDFTVNGLYFGPSKREVIDLVNGISHVEKGILSCIQSPQETFSKDKRRYLRAIRFKVEKGFKLDSEIEYRIEKFSYNDIHFYKKMYEFAAEYEKFLSNDECYVEGLCELLRKRMVIKLPTLMKDIPGLIELGTPP